ncbi:double-strand break repair protein AddB [Celeribacter baekdonensis]|uniref:Double-strand break repair protein AddB n=1 Tax=Celeribacter baekdonensis TaxID=875171 RepID=A0A2R4M5Q0_9RHOB|nr:double-strand break repair protein AddB [Celeribacter baekdonensis]AVW92544.1 double-strand break repair protein AddB [Celeribacter baekdonensis]
MFGPIEMPHLFGLPCGVDYPVAFKQGILERFRDTPPEVLARTQVFVNTSRMKKDILSAFDDGSSRLLPQVKLISELGSSPEFMDLPMPISGLRRRLELSQLVSHFLRQEPQFATRASVFDLSDSLAALLSEMQDEGVTPECLKSLKIPDASGHWEKSLAFLSIIFDYFGPTSAREPSREDRLRLIVDRLEIQWAEKPPNHPIIVAGSTGSRGTMARFMALVSRLPMGAVVLPGVDFDIPLEVWQEIAGQGNRSAPAVEHPQERTVRLAEKLGLAAGDIQNWAQVSPPNAIRNRLISLSLRPAPVTYQWMKEGPAFQNTDIACSALTLIEAPDMRIESNAIALILREAAQSKRKAALITPDRDLARRVTALLGRWNITPDDSAGIPLNQTPPGRLLRHIVGILGRKLSSEDVLVLLKHPLTSRGHAGDEGRGYHLLWTRELEVHLRRKGVVFPDRESLLQWAISSGAEKADKEAREVWATWIADLLDVLAVAPKRSLADHIDHLVSVASLFVKGAQGTDDRELWGQNAGRETLRLVSDLRREADYGGTMNALAFADLFRAVLGRGLARDPSPKHPQVMIWGTLEARALGADLVILGGLNETIWPQAPGQDPWFSRDMRKQAGLLSPEQATGLSAHDFQQAVGAPEVVLTRAKRDAEAETVASRWLIRLTNLMSGMSDEGRSALEAMRKRGADWIKMADDLDRPNFTLAPAKRPSPRPPVEARPRQLSVTRIETLIRDPYDIYASRILRLNKLDPLSRDPDVRERGTAFHAIMESYLSDISDETFGQSLARFMATAERVLEDQVAWPSARRVWLGRVRKIAEDLVRQERARLTRGQPAGIEVKGAMHFTDIDFSLTCKADRIDRKNDDTFVIYDYKSGRPPSEKQTRIFNIQLLLEAAMLEAGRFENLPIGRVTEVTYLGLDSGLTETSLDLEKSDIEEVQAKLRDLIRNYDDPETGYSARRMMAKVRFKTDFEHLARFGEWSEADEPMPEDLQ